MVDGYMLNKLLDKIKETIGIEKFYDTKILIDIDDILSDDITSENVTISTTRVIKDDNKLYPQLSLDHALYDE